MYQEKIEMKWKNEEDEKKSETITNLLIKQNDYEEINHLMSDWSSNWENNNINYEDLLLTIKKNTKTRIIASNEQHENQEETLHWVSNDISNSLLIESSYE